ncbi:MAG: hypothetical protein MSK40_04330 [Parabacteroides sp.]|nr:hypothetical protein [Parabacteroides sp.]
MAKDKVIMAWSKCKVELAPMPEDESMADDSAFFDVGYIRTNTTSLSANEGDALQAIETGGAIIAEEKQEGDFSLSTEIIEPSARLYKNLGIGVMAENGDDINVTTHIVPGNYCMRLTPKNLGAMGISAPKCSVSVTPAFGDDTGNALTLNVSILQGTAGYWYKKFLHRGDLKLDKYKVSLENTDSSSSPSETVAATTDESTVTAVSNASWCVTQVTSKSVKIGAKQNRGEARTATVTITAGTQKSIVTVTQAGA